MMLRIGFDNSRVNVIPGEIKIIPTATSFPHETTFFYKSAFKRSSLPYSILEEVLGKINLVLNKSV